MNVFSQRSEARRLKLKDDGLGLQITNTASPEANKLLSYKGEQVPSTFEAYESLILPLRTKL